MTQIRFSWGCSLLSDALHFLAMGVVKIMQRLLGSGPKAMQYWPSAVSNQGQVIRVMDVVQKQRAT